MASKTKRYIVYKKHQPEGAYKDSLTELTYPDAYDLIGSELGLIIEKRDMLPEEAEMVNNRQHIESVELDSKVSIPEPEVTIKSNQVSIDEVKKLHKVDRVHKEFGLKGKGQHPFVLDTGITEAGRAKLGDRIGYIGSFVPNEGGVDTNERSHGTWCVGCIAEIAPEATLHSIKVLSSADGSGYNSWIIAGLNEAVARGATHINMSLGGSASPALDAAVNTVVDRGIVVVVAAGNEQSGQTSYVADVSSPARAEKALTVPAVDDAFIVAPFSNWGVCNDIAAIGRFVQLDGWLTGYWSGTSMASPVVCGAAVLVSSTSKLDGVGVRKALLAGCRNINQEVFKVGMGAMDVYASIAPYMQTPKPVPVPEPTPAPSPSLPPRVGLKTLHHNRTKYYGKPLTIYTQDATTGPMVDRWVATPIKEESDVKK